MSVPVPNPVADCHIKDPSLAEWGHKEIRIARNGKCPD